MTGPTPRLSLVVAACAVLAWGCAHRLAPLSPDASTRLDPTLVALYETERTGRPAPPDGRQVLRVGDSVLIEATAAADPGLLLADLEAAGLTAPSAYGVVVNGRLPISALPALASMASLRYARPVYQPARRPPSPPERVGE